jgi:WD40 repeat protein
MRRSLFALLVAVGMGGNGEAAAPPAKGRLDLYGDPLPPGAVARLGTVRLRPASGRGVLAVSPNGKTLATGEEKYVRLWDLATGRLLRSFDLGRQPLVLGLRFSPDGKFLAALVDPEGPFLVNRFALFYAVDVVEVASGKVLHSFSSDTRTDSIHFLAGSRILAAGGHQESTIDLWDLATGKKIRRLTGVVSSACSPAGDVLAVGGEDGVIQLWRPSAAREVRRLTGHRAAVTALAFSPDGKTLASGAGDATRLLHPVLEQSPLSDRPEPARSVRLWDVGTGKERARLGQHRATIRRLGFGRDGQTLFSQDEANALVLWDVGRGKPRERFKGRRNLLPWAGFSPDGKVLAWIAGDDSLRLWDVSARKERRLEATGGWPWRLTFSSDGRLLVGAAPAPRIWDVVAGKEMHDREAHRSGITQLVFSPDGRMLASRDGLGVLRLWEGGTGRPLPLKGGKDQRVFRFGFGSDGKSLAALGSDLVARRWEHEGDAVRTFSVGRARLLPLWEGSIRWPRGSLDFLDLPEQQLAVFSPGADFLAVVGEDRQVHVWDMATGRRLPRLAARQQPRDELAFTPDGKALLMQSPDHKLQLWAVPSGQLLQELPGKKNEEAHFAFSPEGRTLAWGWGEVTHLWDLNKGQALGRLCGRVGAFERLVFDRDGKALATSDGGTVRLWDVGSGVARRTIESRKDKFHAARLHSSTAAPLLASFSLDPMHSEWSLRELSTGRAIGNYYNWRWPWAVSPDGRVLAVVGEAITLRETATGRPIGELPLGHRGHITTLAFSPNGRTLATGGSDTSILLWDWARACGLHSAPTRLDRNRLAQLWDELALADPLGAYPAIAALVGDPEQAVPFLRRRLQPVSEAQCRPVRRLLAELDSDDFAVREKATTALRELHADWLPLFDEVLCRRPSLEVHRRLERLLAEPIKTRWSPDMLRRLRAVQALERIGTPAARPVLRAVATGLPASRLTQEAQFSLQRLAKRP